MRLNHFSTATADSVLRWLRERKRTSRWLNFCDTYWKVIHKAALRRGLEPKLADEIAQEILMHTFQQTESSQSDSSRADFKKWLCHQTLETIQRRTSPNSWAAEVRLEKVRFGFEVVAVSKKDITPAAAWELDWEENLRDKALERLKRMVAPKQFQIFHLGRTRRWSAVRVARTLRLNTLYVLLVNCQVKARLGLELRRIRRAMNAGSALSGTF
jgi:RNA polymerase sigma-70 factor (ECF subfamily)